MCLNNWMGKECFDVYKSRQVILILLSETISIKINTSRIAINPVNNIWTYGILVFLLLGRNSKSLCVTASVCCVEPSKQPKDGRSCIHVMELGLKEAKRKGLRPLQSCFLALLGCPGPTSNTEIRTPKKHQLARTWLLITETLPGALSLKRTHRQLDFSQIWLWGN